MGSEGPLDGRPRRGRVGARRPSETGRTSLPAVYVDGAPVGGYTDGAPVGPGLPALHQRGDALGREGDGD